MFFWRLYEVSAMHAIAEAQEGHTGGLSPSPRD